MVPALTLLLVELAEAAELAFQAYKIYHKIDSARKVINELSSESKKLESVEPEFQIPSLPLALYYIHCLFYDLWLIKNNTGPTFANFKHYFSEAGESLDTSLVVYLNVTAAEEYELQTLLTQIGDAAVKGYEHLGGIFDDEILAYSSERVAKPSMYTLAVTVGHVVMAHFKGSTLEGVKDSVDAKLFNDSVQVVHETMADLKLTTMFDNQKGEKLLNRSSDIYVMLATNSTSSKPLMPIIKGLMSIRPIAVARSSATARYSNIRTAPGRRTFYRPMEKVDKESLALAKVVKALKSLQDTDKTLKTDKQ